MKGKQADLLKTVVTTATGWRATATQANVRLSQLNFVMPDGKALVLFWDDDDDDWTVSTQG